MNRDKLIDFINKTLRVIPDKDPYLFNGLQVVGKNEVSKIALGVSANLKLFQKAAQFGAEMIIVHHGLLGPKINNPITQVLKNRLKILFDHNITLLTYHLFLDNHPTLGNNSQIIKLLKAVKTNQFGYTDKQWWGWEGEFEKAISITDLIQRCKKICGLGVKFFPNGPKMIKKFAIVSGGGPYNLPEAIDKKLDAYLTGESREWSEEYAKEANINYLYLGHYNSEKFGVIALGNLLKKKFPQLEIKFIEIPNNL